MTLSVVAIPQPSLVVAPADIGAHWGRVEPLLRVFFLAVSLFSLTLTARGQGSNPGMVGLMEQALERLA
jgi:hypothetical protein